jgi:choline dehydrogenase-like flavoprotein
MEAEAFPYRETARSYFSGKAGRVPGEEAARSRAVVLDTATYGTYLLAGPTELADEPAPPADCCRVVFTTGKHRPPSRIAVVTGVTGWDNHLDGAFDNAHWTFELRGDQFTEDFEFKLTLDHVSFMGGENRKGRGGTGLHLDDGEVRFEELVTLSTDTWAPNNLVTLRTSVDGWSRDIFGVYVDGAWRFALDRAVYPATFDAKFVLDRRWFMEGRDLHIVSGGDPRHDFVQEQVSFGPHLPAFRHGYDKFHSVESQFEQRTVRGRGRESELYDVIVIGSGMGGGVLADELSDAGVRTLVLEAGGLWFPLHTNEVTGNWLPLAQRDHIGHFVNETVGGVKSRFQFGVHFNLGGRSVYWSGIIPRMREWEFREGWPRSVRDYLIQPGAEGASGYDRAEQLVRKQVTGGPFQNEAIDHLKRALGEDFLVGPLPRSLHQPNLSPRGVLDNVLEKSTGVFSTADLLLDSASFVGGAGADNLAINLNHLAVGLETESNRVSAVVCQDLAGNEERRYRGRHVVLACGSIESPRLALDSGLRDPSGKIGRGLSDHTTWFYNPHPLVPEGSLLARPDGHAKMLVQHRRSTASAHPYNVEVLINPTYWDFRHADREVGLAEIKRRGKSWAEVRFIFDSPLDERNRIESRGPGRKLSIHVAPNEHAAWFGDEVNALRNEIFDAIGLTGSNCPARNWVDKDWNHGNAGTVHHAGGSLRMSPDGSGVVDEHLRFEAYDNLYCCDCSVWPSIPAANPSLTLVALALRLADTIHDRLTSDRY